MPCKLPLYDPLSSGRGFWEGPGQQKAGDRGRKSWYKLELESQLQALSASADFPGSISTSAIAFDVSKCISLVLAFREAEVDSYFAPFERLASPLQWPIDIWPLLLQCKLSGKAQEVVAALPLKESLIRVLKQLSCKLMNWSLIGRSFDSRGNFQTYVEFAREKGILFDNWCLASKASDYDCLREVVLLEDFRKHS